MATPETTIPALFLLDQAVKQKQILLTGYIQLLLLLSHETEPDFKKRVREIILDTLQKHDA